MIIVMLKDRLFCHENHYLHLDCFVETASRYGNIQDKILYPDTTRNLKGFDKLSFGYQAKVKEVLFPHLVDDSIKYQLTIHYNISKLDYHQLKIEMQKRNISIFEPTTNIYEPLKISYHESLDRLKNYLDNFQCQAKHKQLIWGFCRIVTTTNNLAFIDYLIRIIFKYAPLYICE